MIIKAWSLLSQEEKEKTPKGKFATSVSVPRNTLRPYIWPLAGEAPTAIAAQDGTAWTVSFHRCNLHPASSVSVTEWLAKSPYALSQVGGAEKFKPDVLDTTSELDALPVWAKNFDSKQKERFMEIIEADGATWSTNCLETIRNELKLKHDQCSRIFAC